MNRSFSLSECVGHAVVEGGRAEVFATIEATYHAEHREVEVTRNAHLSPEDMHHIAEHLQPDWLPQGTVVKAGCDAAEMADVARDIFHDWVQRVRTALAAHGG